MPNIPLTKAPSERFPSPNRQVFRMQTNQTRFACDIADVIRMMQPGSIVLYNDNPTTSAITINHVQYESDGKWRDELEYISDNAYISHTAESEKLGADTLAVKRYQKRAAKKACYELFKRITGYAPPWGSLTGIRPTKLYSELERNGVADPAASLIDAFDVREDKARLLKEICAAQKPYLDVPSNMADIYVAIPFCPSKCTYCAFHSEVSARGESELDSYLDALTFEMDEAKKVMEDSGLQTNAIYIGGGTPTALSLRQLTRLLDKVSRTFAVDRKGCLEYTVEAGRPDTITAQKLAAMKAAGVSRISINPQTMNDGTLAAIGRKHTAAEIEAAFELARKAGFDNINSDLILALPGETPDDVSRTLERMKALNPESLTLHALSLKHASQMSQENNMDSLSLADAEVMNVIGEREARGMGMTPYYLYRQKNIAGGLENVGYSKPGCVCQYNLDMMEETTSVVALGAGAISKRITKSTNGAGNPVYRIDRSPNMMDSKQYVSRVADMAQRKRDLFRAAAK